jgi:hypothetical protein
VICPPAAPTCSIVEIVSRHAAWADRLAPVRRYKRSAAPLAAHRLEVPEVSTYGARAYVGQSIEEDRARGIPICPLAEAFAMGSRSAYASLPSVDAFRRRKESGSERQMCAKCRHLSGPQCDAHLEGHYQAWRGPCDYGRSWRPLRHAITQPSAKLGPCRATGVRDY